MTDVRIELERPLPERVAVGAGTALSLSGVAAGDRVRALEGLLVEPDGVRAAATARMVRPRLRKRAGGLPWWGIVGIEPVESPNPLRLGLRAELRGGGEAETELDPVELRPGLGAEYEDELEPTRNSATVAARAVREEHPGEPVVAIAVATHEPPRELFERQIESIRGQTHRAWICVISDDGSSEDSLREMRALLAGDPRFLLWPSKVQRGAVGNFERALAMVPGNVELVAPADQTGYWYPQKLEVLSPSVQGDVALAYGDMRTLSLEGEPLSAHWCDPSRSREATLGSLLVSNFVPGSSSVLRRDVLDDALPFPPQGAAGRHDHWLALTAMTHGRLSFHDLLLGDHHLRADSANTAAGRWHEAPGRQPAWRDVYLREYRRIAVAATVLRMRAGRRLPQRQLDELERITSLESEARLRVRLRARVAHLTSGAPRRQRRRLARAVAKRNASERRARLRRRLRPKVSSSDVTVTSSSGDAGLAGVFRSRWGVESGDMRATSEGAVPFGNGASVDGDSHPQSPRKRLAIDVQDLHKSFAVPLPESTGLRGRLRHPIRIHGGSLTVLDGISFQVERGEFFGIVGRNGSGKSTLLKILAGVYGPDQGRVRVTPRVAPVIELGVGFNAGLPALPNVILNCELMGVPEVEARRRFDSIMEFAGLTDFPDLELKNYSSGMRVRLAFSIATQVEGELLLLDEVLAVGDPAFQRKCGRVFDEVRETREATVVLVTNAGTKVQRHCDRAMLLEGGRIEQIGDPAEIARRYAELGLEDAGGDVVGPHTTASARLASIVDLRLEEKGDRVLSVHSGQSIRVHASIETSAPIEEPGFRLEIRNQGNAKIFAPPTLPLGEGQTELAGGERLELETAIENRLAPGPYKVNCTVCGLQGGVERAVSPVESIEFVVVGGPSPTEGAIDLGHELRVSASSSERATTNGGSA